MIYDNLVTVSLPIIDVKDLINNSNSINNNKLKTKIPLSWIVYGNLEQYSKESSNSKLQQLVELVQLVVIKFEIIVVVITQVVLILQLVHLKMQKMVVLVKILIAI